MFPHALTRLGGESINKTDENKVILFEEVAVEQRSRYLPPLPPIFQGRFNRKTLGKLGGNSTF